MWRKHIVKFLEYHEPQMKKQTINYLLGYIEALLQTEQFNTKREIYEKITKNLEKESKVGDVSPVQKSLPRNLGRKRGKV